MEIILIVTELRPFGHRQVRLGYGVCVAVLFSDLVIMKMCKWAFGGDEIIFLTEL